MHRPCLGQLSQEVWMKNRILIFVIFVCCGAFISCIKVEPKKKSDQDERSAPVVETTNVEAKLRGLDEPNQYVVEFLNGDGLYVRKIRNGVSTINRLDAQFSSDPDVMPGDHITYQFSRDMSGGQIILKTIDVVIPTDFVFEKKIVFTPEAIQKMGFDLELVGSMKFVKSTKFKRIFFLKESVLVTNGENFHVIADEIFFHQAQIVTFEEGQTAGLGQNGRSGGTLNFQAKKISGEVVVELRGENGGQGLEGPVPDLRLKGADGVSGSAPVVFTPPTCPVGEIFCGTCQSPGTQGGPGQDGFRGYPGGRGRSGGSSGELRWIADDATELNWKVVKSPGIGGTGGIGGKGGAPGKGGSTPASMFCPVIPANKDGNPGEIGPAGEPGESGQAELACLQIPGERICR